MRGGGEGGWEIENGDGGMKGKGEGGNKTGVNMGESVGLGGGLGGEAAGWRSSNSGNRLRKSMTSQGLDHKSIALSVVGLAGQSKMCETVCESRLQCGQISSAARPIRH